MSDTPRGRCIPTPKFGATVTNHYASPENPHRTGYFVRAGRNTGRMNSGPWWEITDGRGGFWQLGPDDRRLMQPEDFPHLTVDRSTELPTPIEVAS
jgi:hypothetical protein